MCQGAVPALLPFLATQRGYSYAALGSLVLFSGIASSFIQPIFGLLADRAGRPWLIPVGVLLGGAGVASVGVVSSYPATALAVGLSGLGVAAFHPEAARFANFASGGQHGRGMSMFSVGGNAGFALGPLLTTPLVLAFGLEGTLGLMVLPLIAGTLILKDLPHLQALERRATAADEESGSPREDDWGALSRLGVLVCLRSGIYFGLQAFIPAYFVAELSTSEAAGNGALTLMLAMGAVGTLVGGGLVDRWGARTVLVGTQILLLPLLATLPLAGAAGATALLGLAGFVTIASFSITIVLGQAYLPTRVGLASGITLGLAIGLGGVAATALGVVADAAGLTAVLWVIALLPVPALLLSLSLPTEPRRRPLVVQTADAGNKGGR
jgi:MFS transporter, FSR family, fosmidomycin resistance protein